MEQTASIVSSVGFPIAALIGLALGSWRAMCFLAPRVDSWFMRHFALIDQLTDRLAKIDALPTVVETHGCRLPLKGIDDLVCFVEDNRKLIERLESRIKDIERLVDNREIRT